MATKVKLRQKPMAGGKESLHLDFYPPIVNPQTGKSTRREFLKLYVYSKPRTTLERKHNTDTMLMAEQLRFKRENMILKEHLYTDIEREQYQAGGTLFLCRHLWLQGKRVHAGPQLCC